jgi:hypothetical protein
MIRPHWDHRYRTRIERRGVFVTGRWVGMLVEDVDCLEVVVGVVDFDNTIVVVDYCIDTAVAAVDSVAGVVVDSDYWSIAAATLFDVVEFAAVAVATKKIAQV